MVMLCVDFRDDSGNVTGICEQSDGVTSMDCSESEMLNDIVEIISAGGQVSLSTTLCYSIIWTSVVVSGTSN